MCAVSPRKLLTEALGAVLKPANISVLTVAEAGTCPLLIGKTTRGLDGLVHINYLVVDTEASRIGCGER